MILSPALRATIGLGFTQIVGWGTTFLMPAVLGRHIQESLGLASEVVFAGITVMFGVGSLLAPQVGRLIDRTGARILMASGSASAPPVIAAVLASWGTAGALWLIFAAAALSLVSMVLLARLARNVR